VIKRLLLLAMCLFVFAGCSTPLQKQSSGKIHIPDKNYEKVYSDVMQAAVDSGFVISSSDKDNGLILATIGANPLLTNSQPIINIFLKKATTGIDVSVKSTIRGQLYDYGISKNNVALR